MSQLSKAKLPRLIRTENQSSYCVSCGLCVEYCPTQALQLTGEKNSSPVSFDLHQSRCVECNLCIQICPVDALELGDERIRVLNVDDSQWLSL